MIVENLLSDTRCPTHSIIGAAIEVHKILGPGLLESAYEYCLASELEARGLFFQRQVSLPIIYKGKPVDCGYRLDFLIENTVIVELKAIEKLMPIHDAQLMTYLKLSGMKIGLLINFNVPFLKNGVRRIIV